MEIILFSTEYLWNQSNLVETDEQTLSVDKERRVEKNLRKQQNSRFWCVMK